MKNSLLVCVWLSIICWQCGIDQSSKKDNLTSEGRNSGELLAERYCSNCHLFPSPKLLDKKTWIDKVLPNMAARLGLRPDGYDPFEGVEPKEYEALKKLNVYPKEPLISELDWLEIVEYYGTLAPEILPQQDRATTPTTTEPIPFKADIFEIGNKVAPQVTLLDYDDKSRSLYIGDHLQLYQLSSEGRLIGSWQLQSPAVDIATVDVGTMLLSIGEFNPSEKKEGVLFPLMLDGDQSDEKFVISALQRPVQFDIGKLLDNENDDVIICSFGNHQGTLTFFENFNSSNSHELSSLPGARKALIYDLNGDGKNDVIALMAQAWEQLVVFYNEGNGMFRESTLLNFPSVFGSSYFELVDFNEDGNIDVLLTNGDNWDYSRIAKPYHGLRIFINDGTNQFNERYFYPLYGCSEAQAVDFDRDGDLDIAAIAFYSDVEAEGFVYLENQGDLNFKAGFANETACGKWLTMDTGDFNNDGYPDIFLGSYFHNATELVNLMAITGIEAFPEVMLLTYSK